MKCPKCNNHFERLVINGIPIERCSNCLGLWFDIGEAETLRKLKNIQFGEVVPPALGEQYNQIDDIQCPKCGTQMTKMVDAKQPHICYEKCPVCYGIWFDNGEFSDYRRLGFAERLRYLFH